MAEPITQTRLRELAAVHPEQGRVLSVFLNLDPAQFGTPAARSSAITSVITAAAHKVEEADGLSHEERMDLRDDVERVRDVLHASDVAANGTRAVAVYACGPEDLLEIVRLRRPVENKVVLGRTAFVEPLVLHGTDESWLVLLSNRRAARLFVGPDTSTTHLAAAAGCPTVALFGPTDPRIWGPWPAGGLAAPWNASGAIQQRGNVVLVQNPLPCLPCQLEGCERHVGSASVCLQELAPEQVLAGIDLALNGAR